MTNGNSTPPSPTSVPPVIAAGPATTVTAGTLIMDTYEIEKLINSGGMGEVYRGRNIHNGEPVAIKIVLPSLAHDPKIVALFQKESTVLSRLSHDAIVRYHTFTIDRTIGRPCMVMEFVSGLPLSERIEQGPMPLDEVKTMFRRVASGLDKAHRAGVVHRDLSPDNVILEEGSVDHAKLIDFGIAKSASFGGGTLLGGQFAGKFNWVAPEQLGAFGGLVDGRSDIYSLALVTAAASRGKVVAMGDSIVDAVGKRSAVPDLTGVDPALLPLLRYMLQPDPALRPENMAAALAALDNPALVPSVVAPPPDANRTVIGGALPIAPPSQPPISQAPVSQVISTLPPLSALPVASPQPSGDWSVPADRPVTTNPATTIAPQSAQTQTRLPLASSVASVDSEDISPFGAPGAAVKPAVTAAPQVRVAKKGKGGVLAVVGLLVVVGAGAGAYLGGFIGPAPETGIALPETQAEAEAARIAADKIAAETAAAEAKVAAADQAAALAEATIQADLAAAQAETDRIAVEAKAKADAAAAEAAATQTAEQQTAARIAAEQAEKDRLAAEAKAAEDQAAAEKVAAEQTAAEQAAAEQAAAENAAAEKAAEEAEAAQAKATEVAAEAAAAKAAEVEAARLAAAAAADADPMAAQLAWLTATPMPECTHLRPTVGAGPLTLDGYAITTAPLEQVARTFKADLNRDADIAPRLINEAQCPVIDFANRYMSAGAPVLTIERAGGGDAVKSGSKISVTVDGLNGRPYAIYLFSDGGGATNLKPFGTPNDTGSVTFNFSPRMADGSPPTPQVVLVLATDEPLLKLDLVKDGHSAKSVMPFTELALKDTTGPVDVGLSFFRLEN